MNPRFFRSVSDLRKWFAKNHASLAELWVGYYKVGSGKPSVTWPESVREALRVGWIDGIRKRLDDESYVIRFTARRPGSIWSGVNIRTAKELIEEGVMAPAGHRAYEARRENKSGIYAYEQRSADLDEPFEKVFRKNRTAWSFFQSQPASYRKVAIWWVVSAKTEGTRLKHLLKLIEDSAEGRRLPQFRPLTSAREKSK